MNKEIVELQEDISKSILYSKDLAPVPPNKRSWNKWDSVQKSLACLPISPRPQSGCKYI